MASIQTKKLYEAYAEMQDEIVNRLEEDEDLQEIKEITLGDQQNIGKIKSPSLWIIPSSYEPEIMSGSKVQHDILYDFVAMVKDNDPEKGKKKAQELSLKMYDVLVNNSSYNDTVAQIRPQRIDPAYDIKDKNGNNLMYWSAVQIAFRILRREF